MTSALISASQRSSQASTNIAKPRIRNTTILRGTLLLFPETINTKFKQLLVTHTTLFAIKGSNNKKTNKTKKKRNKPLQDKSNTTRQHNSILGLIFSTQSTYDIIGYGEYAQKIRFSITYAHRRQRKVKHFHAAGRNFFGSSIEYFHEYAYNYIFQRLTCCLTISLYCNILLRTYPRRCAVQLTAFLGKTEQ